MKHAVRWGAMAVIAAMVAPTVAAPKTALTLAKPQRLRDARVFLDVEDGHATPNFADWDGDGRRDLLVGQYGGGRVRLYRNVGEDSAPRFDGFEYMKAGGADARVPVT